MRIKNIIAAICGVILIACMAAGLPVFAAETDDVVYVDINGDGQIDAQEIAYWDALALQNAAAQTSDVVYTDINGDGQIDAQEIAYWDALALQNAAAQTDEVIYQDIDGDGQISQAERDYAEALRAMQDYHERRSAREAAGIYSTELLTSEDALGNDGITEAETTDDQAAAETAVVAEPTPAWDGSRLTKNRGSIYGPSGKEVYYNLNMTPVITLAEQRGIPGSFWVRDDGVKMYGEYIMVAASYAVHPYGSLVETSLGTAIVLDTGGFAEAMPNLIDIAVRW